MVCERCNIVVKQELEKLGWNYSNLQLGKVEIAETPCAEELSKFRSALLPLGLELIEKPKIILIERIKTTILDMVYNSDGEKAVSYSVLLSNTLNHDYTYLANCFSEMEGIPIAQFVICTKIKRAQELLWSDEFTLTQIAWKLNYSSVAHLSAQFKKVTGKTPSEFKQHTQLGNEGVNCVTKTQHNVNIPA